MQRHHAEFERRGVALAAVAQGTGDEAARFCRTLKTGFPCGGDPRKRTYRAFGLERDTWYGVTLKPFIEAPLLGLRRLRHASMEGARMPHSDVLQLGGAAVLDPDGTVRFLHRAAKVDDVPGPPELLAAALRLRGRS
jgi:hypothetical protein